MEHLKNAISILKKAHDEISKLPADDTFQMVKSKILTNLEQHINTMSIQTGDKTLTPAGQGIHRPLRKIFGKEIHSTAGANTAGNNTNPISNQTDFLTKDTPAPNVKTALQLAAEELKEKVTELYPKFLEIETEAIIDTYSDLEIRGVAKEAGLPVTETNPKNADAKFVQQIKDAIKKKNELIAKGNPSKEK